MRKYIPLILLLLAAAAFIYLYSMGEQTVSLSDFKKQLNNSKSIAIVMDTRNSPSKGAVMQCGINTAGRLGAIGLYESLRNQTFVYEGEQCTYATANSSIKECESFISDSTVFYIRYNPSKNSTLFYKSKALIEGDEDFLLDCPISKMI
jgi:hypothetical protein